VSRDTCSSAPDAVTKKPPKPAPKPSTCVGSVGTIGGELLSLTALRPVSLEGDVQGPERPSGQAIPTLRSYAAILRLRTRCFACGALTSQGSALSHRISLHAAAEEETTQSTTLKWKEAKAEPVIGLIQRSSQCGR
jgi:hypothetical protein